MAILEPSDIDSTPIGGPDPDSIADGGSLDQPKRAYDRTFSASRAVRRRRAGDMSSGSRWTPCTPGVDRSHSPGCSLRKRAIHGGKQDGKGFQIHEIVPQDPV